MLNNIRRRLDDRLVRRCQSNSQQCASTGVTTLVREVGEQSITDGSLAARRLLVSVDIFVRYVVSGSSPENTHKVLEVLLGDELGPGLGVMDTFNVIGFKANDQNFQGISTVGSVVLGGIRSLLPSDIESQDTSAYIRFVQEFQSELETQIEADTNNKVTSTVKEVTLAGSGGKRRFLLQVAVEVSFFVEGASPNQVDQTLERLQVSDVELAGGTVDSKQIQNLREQIKGEGEGGSIYISPSVLMLLALLLLSVTL
ncbi:hypothetical protein DUNSADRAFT_8090 [Dunaliella salina]|uniref:Uncharacterized protein n=1 Tax=Dunaliella salina TaxID=3046 RepID=A0ABQ7FT23_DUNSA|nr:hypothetical protein DUNSADRAFT_8090 [Dunaliella salina]|eukprot:KAF5825619.1 hypothetical protein DUNSADRAFT_8090 [Dunaliella salina]